MARKGQREAGENHDCGEGKALGPKSSEAASGKHRKQPRPKVPLLSGGKIRRSPNASRKSFTALLACGL